MLPSLVFVAHKLPFWCYRGLLWSLALTTWILCESAWNLGPLLVTETHFSKGHICIYLLLEIQIWIPSLRFSVEVCGLGVSSFFQNGYLDDTRWIQPWKCPHWLWKKSGWHSHMERPTWGWIIPDQHDCKVNYAASCTKNQIVWISASVQWLP